MQRSVGSVIGFLMLAAGFDLCPGAVGAPLDGAEETLKADLMAFNSMSGEDAQRLLRVFVKDKERAKKGVALAYSMQQDAKRDKPFTAAGLLALGRAAQHLKQTREAVFLFETAYAVAVTDASGEKIVQAFDGLITVQWGAKRFAEVAGQCEQFIQLKGPAEVEAAKPFVCDRLVQAKVRQGKVDDAQMLVDRLIEGDKDGWFFFQLKGWILRDQGKFDDAAAVYLQVVEKLDGAKGLTAEQKTFWKNRVRYTLTGLYTEAGQPGKATELLRTLIKGDKDNAHYINDLGFILADNDEKLDEAENLVRKALELDTKAKEKLKAEGKLDEVKSPVAFLDSLGWVLFKQKKYKEALEPLKKATADEDEGNQLELWDHLADCYKAQGQKKEAVAAWQKGLATENASSRDIDRRKKVIAKLKAEGIEPKATEPKEPK